MRRSFFSVLTPLLVLVASLCVAGLGGCGGGSPASSQVEDLAVVSGAGGSTTKPVSILGAFPTSGGVPLYAHLFDAGSYDPDGEIVMWEWNFGGKHNGQSGWHDFTETQGDAWHWYDKPGTKVAHLRVTDNDGRKDVGQVKITMRKDGNANPVAMAHADPLYGNAPLAVSFSATGSYDPDGTIEKYEWDFDDGAGFLDFTGTAGVATHLYETGGICTAILRVTDDDGAESTASVEVDVNAPPVAVANADPTEGNAPLTLDFNAVGSLDPDGIIVKWEWDFDDGAGFEDYTSSAGMASHEYTAAGSYTPTLRVTDNRGSEDTDSDTIEVAEPPSPDWIHTWGGPTKNRFYGHDISDDGTITTGGYSYNSGQGGFELLTAQFTSDGQLNYVTSWGGSGDEHAYCVLTSSDGSSYLGGYTGSYGTGSNDLLLLKYDSTGNLLWQKVWGGTSDDNCLGSCFDNDGNILLAGRTKSYGSGEVDALILKYNQEGTLLWQKLWGGSGEDYARDIVQDALGNSYVTGFTASYGAGGQDVLLLKFDPNGNLLWQKTWGASNQDLGRQLSLSPNGDIYIAGETNSYTAGGKDALLVKFDSGGDFNWARTWGAAGGTGDYAWEVLAYDDDNIYVTGQTNGVGYGNGDLGLLLYDSDGSMILEKLWGLPMEDGAISMRKDSNGSLVIAGWAWNANGDWHVDPNVSSSPTGTTMNISGVWQDVNGSHGDISGIEGLPTGVLDSGGGYDDSMVMVIHPSNI